MASRRRKYPKSKQHNLKNVKQRKQRRPPSALALSPYYSFSAHWSYITNQYLCLTSWGTCVGGINEQHDNILEHEASVPWIEESIKNAQFHKQDIQYSYAQNKNKLYNTQATKANIALKPQHKVTQHEYSPEPEAKQQNNDNKAISYPQLTPKNKAPPSTTALSSTQNTLPTRGCVEPTKDEAYDTRKQLEVERNTRSRDSVHVKGQSFNRRLNMFNEAAVDKRKLTEEEEAKKTKRRESTKQRVWKQSENEGVAHLQQFTYSPAAHGVKPHVPRKMSTRDYSKHMKSKENPTAIIVDDPNANASATDKIKYFQQRSTQADDI